jgi:hypothetical protein
VERISQNRQNAASREQTPLIEIARLLARQAARAWAEATQSADLPQTTCMESRK